MKNLMKCAAILAATLLAFGFASCKTNSDDDSGTIAVTSVELNKTSTSIRVGETETLTATVKPDNATDKSVTWTSSDTSIATVTDAGLVAALAAGEATITAKAGDKTATCAVTVSEVTYTVTVTSGTANPATAAAGETVTITASDPAEGKVFDKWTTETTGVTFADESASPTTFTMPASAVTITATYKDAPAQTYAVTVTSGTANPTTAAAGATVTITANDPAEGKVFDKWTTETTGVTFTDETASSTTFIMPASAVTITATYKDAPWDGDLSKLTAQSTEAYATATDGMTLTGTLAVNVKVSIADGATVTLNGVTIEGESNYNLRYAGITCQGNATVLLADSTSNTLKGFSPNYPGIYVPVDKTLTIKGETAGTGVLNASSNGRGAGIGGGYGSTLHCGNIVIEGGVIIATGGDEAAGIGASWSATNGTITISGGTVTATGGNGASGIGSGHYGSSGNITIADTVTKVTATKGEKVTYIPETYRSIGMGESGSCGTVTIGGTEYPEGITESPFVYRPNIKPMEQATADDIGKVIGADGYIYDNKAAAEAEGTTASAMIAYVGSATEPTSSDINASMEGHAHGLAIALSSAGSWQASWSAAKTSAASYAAARPARASTWRLPSAYQWMWMLKGCGSSITPTTNIGNALVFQNGNISDMSQACGGGSIYNKYWTSTEKDGSNAYECRCDDQHKFQSASKSQDEFAGIWAIAIFAF